MKQIIAWVNKWDRKQLEKYVMPLYFANSLDDFESHLIPDVIPLFSLRLAARTYNRTKNITTAHPNLRFYFLQKRRLNLLVQTNELKVRGDTNTEPCVILPSEVFQLIQLPFYPKESLEILRQKYL
jgi:hypothetical protein